MTEAMLKNVLFNQMVIMAALAKMMDRWDAKIFTELKEQIVHTKKVIDMLDEKPK